MKGEKPHKFNIGEGYGIWQDCSEIRRSFPTTFYRARGGDSGGCYKVGDDVILYQPCSKLTFGMFRIKKVETGDFGGVNLRFRITIEAVSLPQVIMRRNLRASASLREISNKEGK